MKSFDAIALSEVLKLVPRPRYVLGTTYTLSLAFFESVVFPCIDRSQLRQCLIVADRLGYQRAFDEGAALLGAGQDYAVERSPMPDTFHAKVWLLLGEDVGLLLVGSGNLTQSGFMTNAELFDAVHFTRDEPAPSSLLDSIRSFLRGLGGMWKSAQGESSLCTEILESMEELVSRSPGGGAESGAPKFIHSFAGPLIEQMPVAPEAQGLLIAAPYFAQSLGGIEVLRRQYPGSKVRIFPAVHAGKMVDLPLDRARAAFKPLVTSRLKTPGKKDAFPHLKLYGIRRDESSGWIFCTSANCTKAAWQGPNVEAGILRPVDGSTLDEYFVAEKGDLPAAMLNYGGEVGAVAELEIAACDVGEGVDLYVSARSAESIPLYDVELTLRAGSHVGRLQKPALFEGDVRARLPYAAFTDWRRPRKVALCLMIRGRDANGRVLTGGCFVENRLLLTADPLHRSAWRGALALLDGDGAPDFGDIAAVFTLARDLFDGRLVRKQESIGAVCDGGEEVAPPPGPIPIAVWPPMADDRELRRRIGLTGTGQIQWLQRILGALLRDEAAHEGLDHVGGADAHATDEGPSEKEQATQSGQRDKACQNAVDRMWRHALSSFEGVSSALRQLCPSQEQALNVWPAAIFMLLATLAVLRAVKRTAPEFVCNRTPSELVDEFLQAMFHDRRQGDDFCTPRDFRYRSEMFPVLAADIRKTYGIRPHPDVSVILLALITEKKLRLAENLYSAMWKRYLDLALDVAVVSDPGMRDAVRRTWRRLICYGEGADSDEAFNRAYDAVWGYR